MGMIKKISIILILVLGMSTIFTLNTSKAVETKSTDGSGGSGSSIRSTVSSIGNGTTVSAGGITDIIKKVLGLIRLLTGLLSIIVIAYTGFEMVTETPEGKKKVKEKMIPIVGGMVLVFMASTIASFIIGVFE